MSYDASKHHRRSIRLRGYDYAQAGAYFVTVVAHGRECLFGEIADGEMRLNAFGKIIEFTWADLVNHNADVELDAFVIMPNHVHGIIVIVGAGDVGAGDVGAGDVGAGSVGAGSVGAGSVGAGSVGAGSVGAGSVGAGSVGAGSVGAGSVGAGSEPAPTRPGTTKPDATESAPTRKHQSLSEIVRQFKTFSARRINTARDMAGNPVWQRNFYEHIIRSERELERIRAYIENNPAQWMTDNENPRV